MRSLLFILSVFPFFFDNCIFASDSEEPDIRAIERSFRPSKQIRFHDTSSDEENRESEDSDSGMPKNSNDRIPECFFSDYSLDGLVNNQLTIPFSSLTHEERSSGSENLKTKTPVKQSTSPRSPSQSDPRYNKKSEKI